MAAGTFTLYDEYKEDLLDGTDDWTNGNHYCMLVTSSYTPATTHTTRADVSAFEVSGGGYAKQDLAGESAVNSAGTVTCDATDVAFGPSVTITARYLIILQGTVAGSAGTDALVGYVELESGADVSSSNGDFNINWPAGGVFQAS